MLCSVAQMIQLTFQAAYDPFHAVFRILRMRPVIKEAILPRDLVRILDFYLLFPSRINGLRLTPTHRRFRKLAAKYDVAELYGDQPDDSIVFNRMEQMQIAAFETLASYDFIRQQQLEKGLIEFTPKSLPAPIQNRVDAINKEEEDLIEFLSVLAVDYPLTGPSGLKSRSGLLEYRYDAA
jgi:hypothetical protein